MLNRNKTYDNSNLRDVQKMFHDGVCGVYQAHERVLGKLIGKYYFSRESVSYERYYDAVQNSETAVIAIGIPVSNIQFDTGMIVVINGEQYRIDHAQFKNYEKPNWYKVYLRRSEFIYAENDGE